MRLSIIVALDRNRLIGRNNQLPWHLPADLKYFKSVTMGHTIVMGRKTFESIGKPLPGRNTIVLSRNTSLTIEGCRVVQTLEEALREAPEAGELFVVGGAEIFKAALPVADRLYITEIDHAFEGDTWFPEFDRASWKETSREHHEPDEKNKWGYDFVIYEKL